MGKIVAICQPNFLPWLGYFEMGHRADIFVMFDDVQYINRKGSTGIELPASLKRDGNG